MLDLREFQSVVLFSPIFEEFAVIARTSSSLPDLHWSHNGVPANLDLSFSFQRDPLNIIGDVFNSGSGENCKHDIDHILHCKNSPNAIKTTGISQELFNQMQLFAQYSAAAYCLDNSNSPGNMINCTKVAQLSVSGRCQRYVR